MMYSGAQQQQVNNTYNNSYWSSQQYYNVPPNQQGMTVSGYGGNQTFAQSPPLTSQAGFSGVTYGISPSQPSPLATPYQPPSSATLPNGPPSADSPQATSSQVNSTIQKSEIMLATKDASPSSSKESPEKLEKLEKTLVRWGWDALQPPSSRDMIFPMVFPWQTPVHLSLPKKKYRFSWRYYTEYNPRHLPCFGSKTQTDAPQAPSTQSTTGSAAPTPLQDNSIPVSISSEDAASTGAPETPTQAASVSTLESATASSTPTIQSTEADAEATSSTLAAETSSQAQKPSAEDAQAVKPAKPAGKSFSWAAVAAKPTKAKGSAEAAKVNGNGTTESSSAGKAPENTMTNAQALAEAIHTWDVNGINKASFLEPHGLINTGKMCYMNSVLQVLTFCLPFYDFLDQLRQRAAHRFKSETPLLDAMVNFMDDYKVIKSASSSDQLRQSLKSEDLEKYGEALAPEFVYEAIKSHKRFDNMRVGQEQDAQEFLGFLLQTLDDECALIQKQTPPLSELDDSDIVSNGGQGSSGDWLEVGRKQRPAVTRSTGSNSTTPITKIFGGLLRSELRVPGSKDSITMEPYQSLQLDIGPPEIRNVSDALRKLSFAERVYDYGNAPQGSGASATKQVFIEDLPPVLILHLKRFEYDASTHKAMKSLKNIDYPLELEIPRDNLPRQHRPPTGESGPKYRLISVVYHHGNNASEGHYTADVRRQDGREWVRIDDTVIRRVRSEDIAAAASETDVKDVRKENAAANAVTNRYGAIDTEDAGDDSGWKEVTTSTSGNKRTSTVPNGTNNTIPRGKQIKDNIKDNKVAYLLFYQRI
jgi:ubiquitin carboxyl-terminal hydrolase 10